MCITYVLFVPIENVAINLPGKTLCISRGMGGGANVIYSDKNYVSIEETVIKRVLDGT